jgi:hypothetical protein
MLAWMIVALSPTASIWERAWHCQEVRTTKKFEKRMAGLTVLQYAEARDFFSRNDGPEGIADVRARVEASF